MPPLNSLVRSALANSDSAPAAKLAGTLRSPFVMVALLWFLGIIAADVFEKDLWERLLFFALLVPWGFVGAGVIVVLTIATLHLRSSITRRGALLSLGILIAGLIIHFGAGTILSMDVRFLIAKPHYERRLAEVLAIGADRLDVDVAGVEPGFPKRVAFYWWKGFGPDNWIGLVYDPSGEVMHAVNFLANPSATFDPVQDEVRNLFGGSLYASRHLTGHWYICWFT
jgi:hypothetical protein